MGHEFKIGDEVRVLDGCQLIAGRVVQVSGPFLVVDYASSTGITQHIALANHVYHRADVTGFATHVRYQAKFLQQQANALELSNSTAP